MISSKERRTRRQRQGDIVSGLRIAAVGFGEIARSRHVPAIAATPGATLVADAFLLGRWRVVEAFEDQP
jgi:hypothetical protein